MRQGIVTLKSNHIIEIFFQANALSPLRTCWVVPDRGIINEREIVVKNDYFKNRVPLLNTTHSPLSTLHSHFLYMDDGEKILDEVLIRHSLFL